MNAGIRVFVLVLSSVISPILLMAAIRLPAFFSDGMVLQREATVKLWGWTDKSQSVSITTSWDKKKYFANSRNGSWVVSISTPKAGGPYTITLNDGVSLTLKDILIGEVWICSGQSNMEMPMKGIRDQPVMESNKYILASKNSRIRFFEVPRAPERNPLDTIKTAVWNMASPEKVANFSATAYFFGLMLNQQLENIPIGLIVTSYGGSPIEAFMDETTLKKYNIYSPGEKMPTITNQTATALYNGMIHPLIGYGIKGMIWYQGESNVLRWEQYAQLFPDLITMLRQKWDIGDFPFYYVQIAPFNYSRARRTGDNLINSAYLRESQRKTVDKLPNLGMVVAMDIGDSGCIHPRFKREVGERLALHALANDYKKSGFGFRSPLYKSMEIKNEMAVISFENAPLGLTSYGKTLRHFEIAGDDRVFYPARAIISKGKIEVSSPKVKNPVAVRYGFKDYVQGDLFNIEGLPASSFRTDDWPEEFIVK